MRTCQAEVQEKEELLQKLKGEKTNRMRKAQSDDQVPPPQIQYQPPSITKETYNILLYDLISKIQTAVD